MNVTVTLPLASVDVILRQFMPVRIHFGKKSREGESSDARWLELESPREVTFLPGRGLQVSTEGQLRYSLAGFTLPWRISALELLLAPEIRSTEQGNALAFPLTIERVDFANIPGFAQRQLLPVLNGVLSPEKLNMVVPLESLLRQSVSMPSILEPLERFEMALDPPSVEVEAHHLAITMPLQLSLTRNRERP